MAANDAIVDRFTRHAVDLERFKAGERKKALRILKQLEDDLVTLLARGTGTIWSKTRMRTLLAQVRETIGSAYDKMRGKIEEDLRAIAKLELSFAVDATNGAVGADRLTVEFGPGLLRSVVGDAVIEGGPQADWWNRQAAKTEQAFGDTVRKGVLSGSTTDEIVHDLRDDVFAGTLRRNVEALVQTSVASVVSDARQEFYDQNTDVLSAVMQRSTLDSRTTLICQAYSGKRWSLPDYEPIDHELPFISSGGSPSGTPRHWRCRSVIVPIVPMFAELGSRMGKKDSARAERAFRKKLRERGDMSDAEIARAQRNVQASMDGYVSEDQTYEEWLATQSVEIQKEALGPRRWELWNAGKLNFSQLIDQNGNPLTLDELRKKLGEAA